MNKKEILDEVKKIISKVKMDYANKKDLLSDVYAQQVIDILMKLKACSKCKQTKSTLEFHDNKSTKDGLAGNCKICNYESMRLYRKNNPERLRVLHKKHNETYFNKHPEKQKAHKHIWSKIHRDCLKRPENCDKCSSVGSIEAHHEDYSNKSAVMWLCRPCHLAVHYGGENG